MTCCSCDPVPTLIASSVVATGTTAAITVRGILPSKGRFNIKFCGRCVPVCNQAETVTITDGTTTYSTVLTRCGSSLTLGALAYQIQRFCVAHFCGKIVADILTVVKSRNPFVSILQDKLLCCPTIYTPPTTAAAAPAETATLASASSSKKA